MAEQNAPETDKIKELLAQLRATFDVEEETPATPPLFSLSDDKDDEPVEEITDEPVEETTDEPVEEITDEPVEETTDEPVEEITDEPVEEITDEPVEETTDEPVEEITDEPVEEITDEPVEETTDEPVEEITDEPVKEIAEEVPAVSEKEVKHEETRGYYQLSIMGDLCDEEKHTPSYYEDEDLTETFIVRPTITRTGNVPIASSEKKSSEERYENAEHFDPLQLIDFAEEELFLEEIPTEEICVEESPVENGCVADAVALTETQSEIPIFAEVAEEEIPATEEECFAPEVEDTVAEEKMVTAQDIPLEVAAEPTSELQSEENEPKEPEGGNSAEPRLEDLFGSITDCSLQDEGDGEDECISAENALGESPYDDKEAPTDYGIPIDPPPTQTEKVETHVEKVPEEPKRASVVSADTGSRSTVGVKTEREAPKSPRIRVAPDAYRQKPASPATASDKSAPKGNRILTAPSEDAEEENFLNTIPEKVRRAIGDHPLGRKPYTAPAAEVAPEKKKKRKVKKEKSEEARLRALFPEEREEEYDSRTKYTAVHTRLSKECKRTRIELIFMSVIAFLVLFLESFPFVFKNAMQGFFSNPEAVGYTEAGLLFLALVAFVLHARVGIQGIFHGRVVPESLAFIELLFAFLYTLVFAMIKVEPARLSFVAVLFAALLIYYRGMHAEDRLSTFRFITANGDKLVLSQIPKKKARAESAALGKNNNGEGAIVYRIRKTAFVEEFSARTSAVCEDFTVNFVLMLCAFGAALLSFVAVFIIEKNATAAFSALFLTLTVSLPASLAAAHFYPMRRTLELVGDEATVLGEHSLRECGKLDAVAFEDVEAIPSKNVKISHMKIYAGDLSTVLHYVVSLLRAVGGPLYGHFAGAIRQGERLGEAKLLESTQGGISATVDGADILLGSGDYMARHTLVVESDADDAHMLADGKTSLMYVAVNGCICAKFYVSYTVSTAFERNVRQLSKLGVAAVIRTYDPNLTEPLLLRISSLGDCRVHVVTKTVSQLGDFGAIQMPAGFVTSSHSGNLLRILFLGIRARRTLFVEKILKIVGAGLGMALGIFGTVLWSIHSLVPSALLALGQLLWLLITVLSVRVLISPPKTAEGKQNEPSRNIRHP